MTTDQLPTEAELESILDEDEDAFFELIYEYHQRPLVAYMNKMSRGLLSQEELREAMQDALLCFVQKVRDPDFDRREPKRMLYAIARNIAVRNRRRRIAQPDVADHEAVIQAVGMDLAGTSLGQEWRYESPDRRQSLQEIVVEIVAGLPERQQFAMLAFLDCYTTIRAKNKYGPIKEAMEALTGQPESLAAVKSALRAGLKAVARELKKRGFKYAEKVEYDG